MKELIKKAILQLSKRSEFYDPQYLKDTFVNMENLYDSLNTKDHQIIFGRRGTGKTHLLRILKESNSNILSIYIDLRTIGSTGGVYNDNNIPLTERSTRLILDVLGNIHDGLLEYVINTPNIDIDKWNPLLDRFAEAITEVVVVGDKSFQASSKEEIENKKSTSINVGIKPSEVEINHNLEHDKSITRSNEKQVSVTGKERYRIHFGQLQKIFSEIVSLMEGKLIRILIDEWSEIALDIQPILADLIKRTILPVNGFSVKIAAIEKRSRFYLADDNRTGIEIGADIPSTIDLDEYLIFDNNKEKANIFFKSLISNHIKNIIKENGNEYSSSDEELISEIFNRTDCFDEFVKATEGVPRDAINILSISCQVMKDEKITIPDIRLSAKKWYNIGKEAALVNQNAKKLLRWIIDEVIGHRRARAFLLNSDTEDDLIDQIFDMRLIHILKKSVSSNDQPGDRFIVYSIDYGCYVDLINTSKAPEGLFEIEEEENKIRYIEVPENDYRSIRRAILDLDKFYQINLTTA